MKQDANIISQFTDIDFSTYNTNSNSEEIQNSRNMLKQTILNLDDSNNLKVLYLEFEEFINKQKLN